MNNIIIPCDCKCCIVCFNKSSDGEDYNISIMDSYYHNHNDIISRIKNSFKVLFGKPIYYNDACISKKEMKKLVENLNDMVKD